ncbi:flavin monoamine oxidase family protein [Lewinella sp. IMCC34183]|uniref:flavin monoamine oxidase family protein n=1 Tax=Lewinella sp. IMCC34183 TaxID=2248762 RepID=UPI000E24FDE7|nr:NAD(P)/FAD-dependent oxidoreductase [Lewinella sp. IMCC34183]
MPYRTTDLLIIGAGLTGLTLAYLLRDQGLHVTVLEARNRLGGRIHTRYIPGRAPVELGATWLGRKHTALWTLLQELDIDVYPQYSGDFARYEATVQRPPELVQLPPNPDPSYRIAGGSSALIRALADRLPPERLMLGQAVLSLSRTASGVSVRTPLLECRAGRVVFTLPPDLLVRGLRFDPVLQDDLIRLSRSTDTWMGHAIKVALTYEQGFWRDRGCRGTAFSQEGPVSELYDHSDPSGQYFALQGFVDPELRYLPLKQRRDLVLQQLERLYGPAAANCPEYEECVWHDQLHTTAAGTTALAPHQGLGHPEFRKPLWGGRLFLAGTETADAFPGYMEGAVRSAQFVARSLVGE